MNHLTKHSAPALDVLNLFNNSKAGAPTRHLLMLWKK
jgi:hypothetical protein